MSRGLTCSLIAAAFAAALTVRVPLSANDRSTHIERVPALEEPNPWQYRALRHLEARNDHLDKSATMDVWTEGDIRGFRYGVVAEEGSEYIRSRVFRKTLETERAIWVANGSDKAALTPDNYAFEDGGVQPDGMASIRLKPRRKDMLLVDGAIFLRPEDGDLVRMEGRLSKAPSFWTRQVQITRWYKRIAGVRLPVVLESTANVRVAGESTFRMTYQYESVNGTAVGGR
jgi:hypothetical protein